MSSTHSHGTGGLADDDALPVTDRNRIVQFLAGLQERHALISVSLPDTNQLYNSAVLGVSAQAGTVTLDELTPEEGHVRLLGERRLQVFARLDGVSLRFESELIDSATEDGIALYHIRLPELVYHGQKRNHYRVRVAIGLKVPVSLSQDDTQTLNGQLRDLSIGGFGAAFPIDARIRAGQRIECGWIDLPGGTTVSCGLEIRYAAPDPVHRELRVGAAFLGLTPVQERAVQRCVHDLEREQLRRQTRNTRP